MTPEQQMSRGQELARQAQADKTKVLPNHLAQVWAHLKSHQDVASTLRLLERLPTSSFAQRSRSTRNQLVALERVVRQALAGVGDWRDAAAIVGWGKKLAIAYHG